MHKEKALEHIEKNMAQGDTLVGFFSAQQPFKIWLFFLIGPLAVLSMKVYFVAVTARGIHFHNLNMLGKFSHSDFFRFDEIENVKIGNGFLQRPMTFKFKNGRRLKIKAQIKGVNRVAKLTEPTQQHLERNIPLAK